MLLWEKTLVVGSWDRMIRLVDLESNNIKQSFVAADQPLKCLIRQENTIYVGGCDSVIRSWNLDTMDSKVFKGHKSWVLDLKLHGDYLYSCSDDKTIMVWNLKTTKCEEEFVGH